jgi:hypothetical protein
VVSLLPAVFALRQKLHWNLPERKFYEHGPFGLAEGSFTFETALQGHTRAKYVMMAVLRY